MNLQGMIFVIFTSCTAASCPTVLYAQGNTADPVLAEAMEDTTISLQQGLTAAASKGRSISAKFEIEDGKLQLSVYTAKGARFSENIIDLSTGKVGKSEPITEGGDLTDAKAQSAAMAKAKVSLKTAADKAEKASDRYRVLSVTPALKGRQGVATVVLLRGNELKTVEQPLR
jgi:hypothetical protein